MKEEDDDEHEWPKFLEDTNPSEQNYLVGVLFEDFADLTNNENYDKSTPKKKKGQLVGKSSSFAGFRFQKAVMIRTRFPFHEFTLEILNSFIGKVISKFRCIKDKKVNNNINENRRRTSFRRY